jgi:uncharacterized SAM-binding protein YcdF (DUF218 family)
MEKKQPSPKTHSKNVASKKVTPQKTAPKKIASKKPAPKKAASPKATPKKSQPPVTASKRKTIAQKTAARWRFFRSNLFRWLLMIPLAGIWYIFTFLMASYSFTALVCLCLIGILLFYNVCEWTKRKFPKTTKVVKSMFTILLCIGLLVVGITEILIIHASFGDKTETCEYMVVLGAKVRHDGPSVSLMDRIRAAADYMNTHPDVIAVVSGGKGGDEPMTEAQCMYNELVKLGIDPNRIWMEENATSTWENLHFSLNLIEEKTGSRPDKIGLLSSEYHLFRAKMFAKACEVEAVGIPAHTSRLSQMINHFMREVAGVWHYIILGGQYSD